MELVWLIFMIVLILFSGIILWIRENIQSPTITQSQVVDAGGIKLFNSGAKTQAAFKMAEDGCLGFALVDKASNQRVTLAKLTYGPPFIEVTDNTGKTRMVMAMESDGAITLRFLNKKGNDGPILDVPLDWSSHTKTARKDASPQSNSLADPKAQPLPLHYDRRGRITWS